MIIKRQLIFAVIRSNFRNNGQIWMEFGDYLIDIDPKLPVRPDINDLSVTMVTFIDL